MAGAQVSKTVAINWFIAGTYGYEAVSIDELDTMDEPQVLAGSRIEIGGELYEFASNEAISGWAGLSYADAYIKFVPSGSSCTAAFTNTAPTWSALKCGWYNGNDRYIFFMPVGSAGDYYPKQRLRPENDYDITAGLIERTSTSLYRVNRLNLTVATEKTLYDAVYACLVNKGDSGYFDIKGTVTRNPSGTPKIWNISHCRFTGSLGTTMTIYGYNVTDGIYSSFTLSAASTLTYISGYITW